MTCLPSLHLNVNPIAGCQLTLRDVVSLFVVSVNGVLLEPCMYIRTYALLYCTYVRMHCCTVHTYIRTYVQCIVEMDSLS